MVTETKLQPPHQKQKKKVLIGMLIYAVMSGGIAAFLSDETQAYPAIDIILSIPLLLLMLAWCTIDSIERGSQLSKGMGVCLVLIFVVAFPLYIIKTRGRGGFITLAYALLFILLMTVLYWVSYYVLYHQIVPMFHMNY